LYGCKWLEGEGKVDYRREKAVEVVRGGPAERLMGRKGRKENRYL
jgi:hypothetical protein